MGTHTDRPDVHTPDVHTPDAHTPGGDRSRRRGGTRGRGRGRGLLIGLVTAALMIVVGVVSVGGVSTGVASAGAGSSIEGIWSFGGGQIGVQRAANGTYYGIVVAETTFAACPHPVGQEIWKDIAAQPDGSYWGLHQWYSGLPPNCRPETTGGPTAWRVIEEPDGSYYLRVCFSHPHTTQPTIAANGDPKEASEYIAHGVTYGCFDSTLISLLPTVSGTTGTGTSTGTGTGKSGVAGVKLELEPSNKQCLSGRRFKIHLPEPKYDPFKTVSVTLKGRKIATVHKGNYVVATINLRGLHKGAFTIEIKVTTVLGQHLSDSRTYRTCVKKKRKPRNKLKLTKEKK